MSASDLNQWVHPENPYKNGLGDLDLLAFSDKEFGKIAKKDPKTGKVIKGILIYYLSW